ncbi:MAG: dihydropteroate synthase [Lachnospiraceae bacterium]
MEIGSRNFQVDQHTYIMGILNVTPDSFSDGGKFKEKDAALFHTQQMIEEGADIIDIGGESTRPGHVQISIQEEIQRTASLVELIKTRFHVPISIDTYKSQVAQEAIMAGADLVNDIWGLKYDVKMAEVIAKSKVACCLMHNRNHMVYDNFMKEVKEDLKESITLAKAAGIADDKIILDPGVGFGKTYEQNLEVICKLEELHEQGYPLLLGTSRKSVIGFALNLPVTERVEGTLTTTVMAVMKHCAFVRVHDVKENKRAIQMVKAIEEGWKP